MNKQKFEEKCRALYAYENEILAKMQEFIKPLNEEFNKCGYKVKCRLLWLYRDEKDDDKYLLTTRKDISYRRPYECAMSIVMASIHYMKRFPYTA